MKYTSTVLSFWEVQTKYTKSILKVYCILARACTFHCKIFAIIIFHCIHRISRRNVTSADNCGENIAFNDSHNRDILPLSNNSKNHFELSSPWAPEATSFIALVTDFAPENKKIYINTNKMLTFKK